MPSESAEPLWTWETCSRGHSLRLHGRPRKSHPNRYNCRACHRESYQKRQSELREQPGYGWRGREHVCSHVYERCEIDETAVLRIMAGEVPERFHYVDKVEAIIRLNENGLSAGRIARRVGCTSRTVVRVRRRIREAEEHGAESA